MSKSLKTIIAVAAAVAIPFAAPYLATSIGMSAAIGTAVGSATAGSVIGGAITGAALGAAKASIFGEDVQRGALMGGLSGGVGGFAQAPTSAIPQSAITAANASADPIAALNASQGFTGVDPSYLASVTAADPIAVMNAQQGFTSVDQNYLQQAAQTPSAGLNTTGLAGAVTPVSVPTAPINVPGAAASGAGTAAPTTFADALRKVPGEIVAKFKDPKNLADLTLRAAGQLAGSVLAGSGLSDEEQALLNQQTEELRTLQQTNQGLFNQRLEQAQNLIGESKYFDPEYFGLQSARRQQLAGAQQRRAGLRGLTGEARESAGRKFDLGIARNVGTAFDTGFQSAIAPRLQTMQAGLSLMPKEGPSNAAGYSALQTAYTGARANQRQTQADIGTLFGSLTGRKDESEKNKQKPNA